MVKYFHSWQTVRKKMKLRDSRSMMWRTSLISHTKFQRVSLAGDDQFLVSHFFIAMRLKLFEKLSLAWWLEAALSSVMGRRSTPCVKNRNHSKCKCIFNRSWIFANFDSQLMWNSWKMEVRLICNSVRNFLRIFYRSKVQYPKSIDFYTFISDPPEMPTFTWYDRDSFSVVNLRTWK